MMVIVMVIVSMGMIVMMIVRGMIRCAEGRDIPPRLVREEAGDSGEQKAQQREENNGCVHGYAFSVRMFVSLKRNMRPQPFIMLMSSTAMVPRLRK